MPGQRTQWHMFKLGQGMIAMHRQYQRVGAQHAADQAWVFEQLRGGRDIDAVIVQCFEHLLGIADFHRDVHMGQAFAKGFDQIEDVIRRRGGNPQSALDLASIAQEKLDIGLLLQQRLDHRQQARAVVTDGEAPPAAVEQFNAVLAFQVANLGGDGGLAQAEFFRRLGNAAQAGDHKKRL